ncbi:MAG: methyltransferase domain-containing protein [Anaerolineales bacterium]
MAQLNLGAGEKPISSTFGVDVAPTGACDVIANFEGAPLPFATSSITGLYAYHVLEHIRDLPALMEEIHRISQPDARIIIEVPYFACVGAFGDPTHVRFFAYHTFRFWTPDTDQANWFSRARFRIAQRRIVFGKVHRLLGIAALANRWPDVYENFLAFIFPGRVLQVELRPIKG